MARMYGSVNRSLVCRLLGPGDPRAGAAGAFALLALLVLPSGRALGQTSPGGAELASALRAGRCAGLTLTWTRGPAGLGSGPQQRLTLRCDASQMSAALARCDGAQETSCAEAPAAPPAGPAAATAAPSTAAATQAPLTTGSAPESTPEITIEEFKRLDLRIARVLSAERVPKKDRLFKVELDLGPKGKRQVVAGLAQLCPPEELVGKVVVFLSNLKPAKIGGIVSGGMILAVGDEAVVGLLTADREVPLGAAIR